jgi:hypothetical protein
MKAVNAIKMIREQDRPACQLKELAKGMKTKIPKSHIKRAVTRL